MSEEVRLDTLRRGAEFDLALETSGKRIRGSLVELTSGSALVELRQPGRRIFTTGEGAEVEIASSGRKREHWSRSTLVVPTGNVIVPVKLAPKPNREATPKLEVEVNPREGEIEMAKQKKEKKERKSSARLAYAVSKEKLATKAGAELLDKANHSHRAAVVRCLNGLGRAATVKEIFSFIDPKVFKTSVKDPAVVEFMVRQTARALAKEGFLRVVEAKKEEPAAKAS